MGMAFSAWKYPAWFIRICLSFFFFLPLPLSRIQLRRVFPFLSLTALYDVIGYILTFPKSLF